MNKKIIRNFIIMVTILTSLLALPGIHVTTVQAAWLSGWIYKRPLTVTNLGTELTDYQLRIELNSVNFNFNHAKSDGSDIRFTAQDGNTALPYWIETWTATNATIWVRINDLPGTGNTLIYMYYGNQDVTTGLSNGFTTFPFFEDFEGSPWTAWANVSSGTGTFLQSTDQAKRGTLSGKFDQPTPSASTIFSQNTSVPGSDYALEWDFYDDLSTPAFKMVQANAALPGGQVGVGVWTDTDGTYYSYHTSGDEFIATSVARTEGWHKFGIHAASDGTSTIFVDETLVGTLTGSINNIERISVEAKQDSQTTYYVDDFRMRKYASLEPTVAFGDTIWVNMTIVFDVLSGPFPVNQNLTYHAAVRNESDWAVTGVVVRDALPAGVDFVSATTTQGGPCTATPVIECSLGTVGPRNTVNITIVVTPRQLGQLTNSISVSSIETESFPPNNVSTVTTLIGGPVVYVVNAIDTEAFNNHPAFPQHVQFDLHNFDPTTTEFIGPLMNSVFRNSITDSFGTHFKMTWFMEMDNFINNGVFADGTPMDYLTLYKTFVNNYGSDIAAYGDELAYHHHFYYWNGANGEWEMVTNGSQLNSNYDEQNNAIDRMILDAGFFPSDFRSGWLWAANQEQAWVDKWMMADYSNYWSTNWTPYHPATNDYTLEGNMNHLLAHCDGGPMGNDIDAAFAESAATGKPTIYCWSLHDRDNLAANIVNLQNMLSGASDYTKVPFKYATSREAIQGVMGTTDTTPPTLTITPPTSGDNFTITSNEPIWNDAPYIAARYLVHDGFKDMHIPATGSGSSWTATIPAVQDFTNVIPPEKYTPIWATASSEAPGNEATKAIDGIDGGDSYWDSTPQDNPNWIQVDLGQTKPVKMVTIHFMDEDARLYTYFVDSSLDGNTWTPIVSERSVHGLATHIFANAIDLRYLRITVTNQIDGTNDYAHIFEIGLYKSDKTLGSLQQVGAGANDLAGNPGVINWTHFTLQPGWNLVSIPFHQANNNPQSVLASLSGNYNLVYGWDAAAQNWLIYDPDPLWIIFNTLTAIDEKMGFWIYITASNPVQLNVVGTIPSSTNINLKTGWNLTGFPAASDHRLPAALQNQGAGNNFSLIYAYHANDPLNLWRFFDRSINPIFNNLTSLSYGWGYWIRASSDSTWHVSP